MEVVPRDICLFTPSGEVAADPNRVFVSSGLVAGLQNNDHRDRIPYAPNAFIPREPWRALRAEELFDIWEPTPVPEKSNGLAIIRLPQEPACALMGAYLDSLEHRAVPSQSQRALDEAAGEVLSAIREVCWVGDGVVFNGVACHREFLPTVTVNTAKDLYIGLHLDSWDKLPFDRRQESTNRVCVNIGTTDRFLLFIPCTLRLILSRLRRSANWQAEKLSMNELVTRFLSEFPDEPVYRVLVRPYEAYIAPTENMIHDGSTANSNGPAYCATYRGHIWLT